MFNKIAHVAFTVSDMEESVKFYSEIFGFTKAFELNDDDNNPWIVYMKINDSQFLELFYSKEKFEPFGLWKNKGYSHLCLETDNIYEAADILESRGIILDVKPGQGKDLNYQLWTHDPDGNAIEVMQMNPDSPQMKQ